MRTLLLSVTLLLTLQASDCATAGSIQDSNVTRGKRELDAETLASPTPTPIKVEDWEAIHERNQQFMGMDRIAPKLPKRPGVKQ